MNKDNNNNTTAPEYVNIKCRGVSVIVPKLIVLESPILTKYLDINKNSSTEIKEINVPFDQKHFNKMVDYMIYGTSDKKDEKNISDILTSLQIENNHAKFRQTTRLNFLEKQRCYSCLYYCLLNKEAKLLEKGNKYVLDKISFETVQNCVTMTFDAITLDTSIIMNVFIERTINNNNYESLLGSLFRLSKQQKKLLKIDFPTKHMVFFVILYDKYLCTSNITSIKKLFLLNNIVLLNAEELSKATAEMLGSNFT